MKIRLLAVFFFLFVKNGTVVYAQSAEYKRLFQEANQLRFSEPQKSLKLFDFLLKNNRGKEALAIENKRLQINRLLENYTEAVKISKEIEDDLVQSATPALEFEYYMELTSLYFDLDLNVEGHRIFKKASEIYAKLSKEEQDDLSVDYYLTKLETDQNINKQQRIQELKNVMANVGNNDPYNPWLHYKVGRLFFPINKDSATSYLERVTASDSTSHLAQSARIYLDLIYTDNINFLTIYDPEDFADVDLQILLLKKKIEFWEERPDIDSLQKYENQLRENINQVDFERRQAKVTLIQNRYYRNKLDADAEHKLKKKRIWIGIGILGLLLIGYGAFKLFPKKERENLKDDEVPEEESSKTIVIPDRTELEIMEKLKNFENSKLFLDKQLRLATLAKQLETNTRYLSSIINSAKGKSFNNYINSLRIQYIIKKLETDPKFLTYKISYLADESGFASQSSFTTAFKDFTGLTPSAYIKTLQIDN